MSLSKLTSNLAAGMAYPGHRHFTQRLFSRRGFFEKTGLTAGALAAVGLLPEVARSATIRIAASTSHGRKSTTTATPLPIPGGLQLLGPSGPLFHVFLPAPGVEPSTITNFNGFIGWAAVGGMGTHTVTGQAPEHLPFEADVRFMRGEYVGADGGNHHGAFAFIWLDVFTSPAEDLQIHDFNPGITESGLFWTIPIPENTIAVNFAAGKASFQASDVDVEDYHDVLNALLDGPEVDAEVSWDIRWSHPMGRTKLRDLENSFTGDFVQNVAQIAWAGQTDTATFVSDPAETSVNKFSLLAHERNGVFFSWSIVRLPTHLEKSQRVGDFL